MERHSGLKEQVVNTISKESKESVINLVVQANPETTQDT